MFKRFILHFIVFFLPLNAVFSQFYNGHQMQFGKNRVQYSNFYWSYYRYEKFDTYYTEYGTELARFVGEYAEKEISRLESFFDYNLDKRIIFIVYNKLTDFRQSNIGLVTGKTESNIGGTFQIDRNKVFLYFEGSYEKFERQISRAITQVLINDNLYGQDIRDNATSSTLLNLPDWYIDGLIAFVSDGWDFETENVVKDGVLSGKYKKFNRLVGEDAKYAGHSFWRYISETYGDKVIPSILYLTKINKSSNAGFYYVLGESIKSLSRNWYSEMESKYTIENSLAEDIENPPLIKKPKKKRIYTQVKISPNGRYIAYVNNHLGKYKIWLYDTETGKKKRIISKENKLEQIVDYSYPALAWHPSGKILTFITEEEGGIKMYYYTLGEKEMIVRNILYFEKILSYSFSPDGASIVLSGVKNSQTDIFVQNIAASTNFQVTNDKADDFSPRFINNGKSIIFSSNRNVSDLSPENGENSKGFTQDLYIYDYTSRSKELRRLADKEFVKKTEPFEISQNKFVNLSDRNGIINRYISSFDSTISYIDTTIHYRYFSQTQPLTNYNRNIITQDYNINTNQVSEVVYKNDRYYMYNYDLDPKNISITKPELTSFRVKHSKTLALRDSLSKINILRIPYDSVLNKAIIENSDTLFVEDPEIDVNNYIFNVERIKMLNEQLKNKNMNVRLILDTTNVQPRARFYQKAFYQNYLVSQVDFSFLSETYQPFTGGQVYFTPGTNLQMKIGTQDLFEDYKITMGIRLPADLNSSEYLISLENLKKRLNKQLFLHKQVFKSQTNDEYQYIIKNVTHDASLVLRYPFSQVSAIAGTFGFRNDKAIYTSLDNASSELENIDKYWTSIKGEYIFDNTRSLGLNLPAGTRLKVFGEYYQQVNKGFDNLTVLGGDIRHYFIIHRNFIWANRFAASTSFGSAKLIYYLGGVDNWTNLSSRTPTFIPLNEIRLTQGVNYAFQTVATNMRGFSQNIRNGSSFALINSELRFPIIRYLVNYPLSNAFLENLQAVGFFDMGTAWSGFSPWSNKNGYDKDFIPENNPVNVQVEIDSNREPIVAGYGFGFRSQLLGYFIRLDWAWGIENMQLLPRVFYFSLALDF